LSSPTKLWRHLNLKVLKRIPKSIIFFSFFFVFFEIFVVQYSFFTSIFSVTSCSEILAEKLASAP